MQEPKYKPLQWVIYNVGGLRGMGQVVAGQFDTSKNSWFYYVTIGTDGGDMVAFEGDITHYLEEVNGEQRTRTTWRDVAAEASRPAPRVYKPNR